MAEKAFVGVAKLFMNGRSQAVRMPAECRSDVDEVTIQKLGDTVIISSKTNRWDEFFARELGLKIFDLIRSYRSRSKSFRLTFPRVFSSTCLTMTAQYRLYLPSFEGRFPDTTTEPGGTLP